MAKQRPIYHKPVEATAQAQARAGSLRAEMSLPEVLLWKRIKSSQIAGLRFRRQHPLGPWIADFYCHEIALVIEIDGSSHRAERKERDALRDRWMSDRRLAVIRVRADDVFKHMDSVLKLIARTAEGLRGRPSQEHPPPPAAPAPPPSATGEDFSRPPSDNPPPSPTGEAAREA